MDVKFKFKLGQTVGYTFKKKLSYAVITQCAIDNDGVFYWLDNDHTYEEKELQEVK